MGGGPQTNYFSRFLNWAGLRACFSGEPRVWQHAAEWQGNHTLTLSIPTMLILTFRILCVDKIRSRAASACISTTITTTPTKISAPRRLQNADFPPPLLLVYETHNECRLGKIAFVSKALTAGLPVDVM